MVQIDFLAKVQNNLAFNIPTGKGSARNIKNTIAIYMPQTLKFNMQADYGAEEVGMTTGAMAKLKDAIK